MAVLTEIHFLEIRPSLKVGKYLSLRQERTKIHNPFIPVIPDDLEHALDNWGDGDHARKHFVQSILPISSLALAAAHVASNIDRRGLAHSITDLNLLRGKLPFQSCIVSILIIARYSA
jgi:hypothetical protein